MNPLKNSNLDDCIYKTNLSAQAAASALRRIQLIGIITDIVDSIFRAKRLAGSAVDAFVSDYIFHRFLLFG